MYREQGALSALTGVRSGPYSGEAKELDTARMGESTLAKLVAAINGASEPRPLAFDRPRGSPFAMRPRIWWGLLLPTALVVVAFTHGLGGGHGMALDAWVRQPSWMLLPYAAAGVLFVTWVVAILRRRTHSDDLRPGTYLFPLDVVIVKRRDKAGRQLLTVRPLGGARDAEALRTNDPRRCELRIRFHDSSEVRLPWPGDFESVHRQLELTQRLLDELTFSRSMDVGWRNDLFFDLRADDSWAAVAPTEGGEAPRKRSLLTAFVLDRRQPLYVLALGVLVGALPFAVRHRVGERMFFAEALARGTPEAMDDYVALGGSYAKEAKAERDAIVERRKRAKLERDAEEAREKAAAKFGEAPRPTPEACAKALEKTHAESHPEVLAMMQRILDNAEGSPASVAIAFRQRSIGDPPNGEPSGYDLARRLAAVEATCATAFARVFSEACPSIEWSQAATTTNAEIDLRTGLDIAYDFAWVAKKYPPAAPGEPSVRGISVVFDVTVHVPGERFDTRPKTTFRLTMPPPEERLTTARPMSLFTIAGPELHMQTGINGQPEELRIDRRVFDSMVARAFDRLYDEVFGLFFRGPPRVPLRRP